MGQSFSLTARTANTARLERELEAAKGKCTKIDKLVVGLERDLKRATEERDELKQLETDAAALEEENVQLERRIAALTEEGETASTSRRECNECEKRIATLREENAVIRRKLIAPVTRPTPVPAEATGTIASLRTQITDLEAKVKRGQQDLRRVMAFAFHDFSLATYMSSWSLRDIVRSRMGDSVRASLVIDKFEYTALIVHKGSVLTIKVGSRVRTVSNAETLWRTILRDIGAAQRPPSSETKPAIADRFRANKASGQLSIANRFMRSA